MFPAFTPFLIAEYICPTGMFLRRLLWKEGGGTIRRGLLSKPT